MSETKPISPPKGISSSPSIFAYQTRLLDRTASPTGGGKHRSASSIGNAGTGIAALGSTGGLDGLKGVGGISHSPGLASLASMARDEGPSTPIRRNVAKMAAGFEVGNGAGEGADKQSNVTPVNGTANGASSISTPSSGVARRHLPSKSVDLVRGQWEQKIQSADKADDTPKASKRYTIMSPPSSTPSVLAGRQAMGSPAQISSASLSRQTSVASSVTSNSTTESVLSRYREKVGISDAPASGPAGVGARREGAKGMSVDAYATKPHHAEDPIVPPSPAFSDISTTSTASSHRPGSVASYVSYHSVLSPDSTGASSQASGRSQAMEDTLAQARANALKRREARLKAQGKEGVTMTGAEVGSASEAESDSVIGMGRTAGGTLKQADMGMNGSKGVDESKVPTLKAAPTIKDESPPIPATPRSSRSTEATAAFENGKTPVSASRGIPTTPVKQTSTPANESKKGSPFAHLFTPPSATSDSNSNPSGRSGISSNSSRSTATDETPKSRSYRNSSTANSTEGKEGNAKDVRAEYTAARAGLVPSGLGIGRGPPPSAYNIAATSNPGLRVPSSGSIGGKDKYGSISSTDRRRLGRHLPRIASGGEGWEGIGDDDASAGGRSPGGTARRVPSNLGSASEHAVDGSEASKTAEEEGSREQTSRADKRRSVDILAPRPPSVASVASVRSIFDPPAQSSTTSTLTRPTTANTSAPAPASDPRSELPQKQALRAQKEQKDDQPAPYTPNKRRSAYIEHLAQVQAQSNTPTKEIGAGEMKGLIKAVGATPARGPVGRGKQDDGEGVTGMSNRLRLSRATLPPSASSAQVAPAPLPSRRLMQTNWMDRQRHALQAYEYLCHVGEALQWIEGSLDEEMQFGVVDMEQGEALQDGVVLAKIARRFLGEGEVRSIWTATKHRYKQTDNINHFLKLVRSVGMPETFIFELTDLYNKRNIPKVIFCIHVLSHLLARLGQAEHIGNLVGHFEFTDEQLAATQKGLQGVAMPNFGDAKATLAKEASWEPEEPEETEEEERDRLLLENEDSIRALQRHLRGRMARQRIVRTRGQLDLAEPSVASFQSRARGHLARREVRAIREERKDVIPTVVGLQAVIRAKKAKERYQAQLTTVRMAEHHVRGVQAQARGMLVRLRLARTFEAVDKAKKGIIGLQAIARGRMARERRHAVKAYLGDPEVVHGIMGLQAVLRGELHRQAEARQIDVLFDNELTYLRLQSHLRGVLVRRVHRAQEEKISNAADVVVAVQAVCRGVLARRRKLDIVRAIADALPVLTLTSIQACARAKLARQNHQTMRKALAKVEVASSVGGLQAFLRSRLAKKQTQEQKKKLEFVSPDVVGVQAQARGYLARLEYREWRDHLHDPHTQGALVFLQSIIRGYIARRNLFTRLYEYKMNEHNVVKIQAIWRGRWERRLYERLMAGASNDIDVPTIQNFMHLLNDTERDFSDQIRIEELRRDVMSLVRDNQALEGEVQELETKIALIAKNKMTIEELHRVKRHARGTAMGNGGGDEFSIHGQGDPFSGQYLDKAGQRKLELYEQLFFTLQTRPEYLVRLMRELEAQGEDGERDKGFVRSMVLSLFRRGEERREEYMFHRFLQLSVHTETLVSRSLDALIQTRYPMHALVTSYLKGGLTTFLQTTMTRCIAEVVSNQSLLDLCTDPREIYLRLVDEEEKATGLPSARPRDRDADQVLQTEGDARALYIRHLQALRALTDVLLKSLYGAVGVMPYTLRYLVREAYLSLRLKYETAADEDLSPIVAKCFLLPFLLPGLIAPEAWGIIDPSNPLGPAERRNLAAIANLVGIIATPTPPEGNMAATGAERFVRMPLQEYIARESVQFRDWIMDLGEVDPLETHFETHELFESTMEAKPISVTRTEVYGMLSVLIKNRAVITANSPKDPVTLILQELEGPPVDYDRGKTTISLRLTNRVSQLDNGDADAMVKEDFVQAKRHVLAVLRIQSGRTLYDVLVARPEEIHEQYWLEEVYRDMALEQARAAQVGLPPTPVEAEYQIESIRSLPFHEVKSRAIEFCMKLERAGKITRHNAYADLLVSIASDIRSKHHLRKMLRQGLSAMVRAHDEMTTKKKGFEESIASYHTFIDSSMASLQKGKKKPIFLSKQYRHQWSEEKQGKKAQFGSYKYTAHTLYEKGILLGINQCSPRQFEKIHIIISSNEVGVFSLEMTAPPGLPISAASQSRGSGSGMGVNGSGTGGAQDGGFGTGTPTSASNSSLLGSEQVRMEDLLQAQFDNEQNLLLFDAMATFSINMLIHQINKKFYSV